MGFQDRCCKPQNEPGSPGQINPRNIPPHKLPVRPYRQTDIPGCPIPRGTRPLAPTKPPYSPCPPAPQGRGGSQGVCRSSAALRTGSQSIPRAHGAEKKHTGQNAAAPNRTAASRPRTSSWGIVQAAKTSNSPNRGVFAFSLRGSRLQGPKYFLHGAREEHGGGRDTPKRSRPIALLADPNNHQEQDSLIPFWRNISRVGVKESCCLELN